VQTAIHIKKRKKLKQKTKEQQKSVQRKI